MSHFRKENATLLTVTTTWAATETLLQIEGKQLLLGLDLSKVEPQNGKKSEKLQTVRNMKPTASLEAVKKDGFSYKLSPGEAICVPSKFCTLSLSGGEQSCGLKWSLQGPDEVLKRDAVHLADLLESYPVLKPGVHGVLLASLKAKTGIN